MKKLKQNKFVFRIDEETRKSLEALSCNKKYKYNQSEVIRDLIKKAHQELINND
jgi:hypothetical protein